MSEAVPQAVGIDVGGTKVVALRVTGEGRELARAVRPTPADDMEATLATLVAALGDVSGRGAAEGWPAEVVSSAAEVGPRGRWALSAWRRAVPSAAAAAVRAGGAWRAARLAGVRAEPRRAGTSRLRRVPAGTRRPSPV